MFWSNLHIFMPESYVSALFVLFQSKWLNMPKTFVSVKFAYFYSEIICFGTFCIISKVQMVKSAEKPCFSQIWIFLCWKHVLALFVLFQSKQLNLLKTLVLVNFAYFYVEIICLALFVLFQSKWFKYAKNLCFGQICTFLHWNYVLTLSVIFQKSKWLNLLKTLVLVKFAYFYAKILCFNTFCIIPVQMVKYAKNPCFGQICIFLCWNHMFQHFLYYSSQMVKSAKNLCFSQICLFLCWNHMFQYFLYY